MSKYAIVQFDDYNTTHSNGGVVRFVSEFKMYCEGKLLDFKDIYTNIRILSCPDETQVGWIYTDKTNIFIDSNYSINKSNT